MRMLRFYVESYISAKPELRLPVTYKKKKKLPGGLPLNIAYLS